MELLGACGKNMRRLPGHAVYAVAARLTTAFVDDREQRGEL